MSDDAYKRAYTREKMARLEAEQLLENKSRELYLSNQQLSDANNELKAKHEELITQQSAMVKNEKLASIGLLSAGVAHEINNPLAFVNSNLEMLESYWQAMFCLYKAVESNLQGSGISDEKRLLLTKLIDEKDLDYISSDFKNLFEDTHDGLERVTNIVQNLQHFSRIHDEDWDHVDINSSLESTLKIINHQVKNSNCQVYFDLQAKQPVWCNLGELNQVFLNLLQNAIHAMEAREEKVLSISTTQDAKTTYIKIKDTGKGIKPEHFEKIFDPFFTTKTVGQGTGLGLYISYKIVKDHKGDINISSDLGKGTEFILELPTSKE
ncbi:sensor histidine kinase [Marinomonas sp. PE14-40]|uniref:sensor histidine kinase n=1 Tax=Marinomonas sp. PE14-40 TaxID=3060621 RepID=UPI003F66F46D